MTGARVTVDDREVRAALARLLQSTTDPRAAMADVGERLLNAHRERFGRQASPDGAPWAPLSPSYRGRKRRNKDKILVLDSYLKDLLRYQVSDAGATLELGTDRVYGATHQFGDPRRNIPARPFLGLSEDDTRLVIRVFEEHLRRAIGDE